MKNRDNRFDNLKGFLIILVVFGHFLSDKTFFSNREMPLINAVIACIYSFHMPAMVMISGFFSKQSSQTPGYWKKQIISLLIPFVFFDLLQWLLISGEFTELLYPRFTLWYLLSLFSWKLMLPVVRTFRFPLTLSLVCALLVGLTTADCFLSISRTVAFFPFFLGGYYLNANQLEKLRRVPKIVSVLCLAFCLGLAVLLVKNDVSLQIYHMNAPYSALSLRLRTGLLLRALVLAMGFIVSLSLFALVSAKKTLLSGLGARTITVYLSHGILIKLIPLLGIRISLERQSFALLGAGVFTASICLLFGNRYAAKGFHAVMDWIGRLILKQDA